MCDVGLGCIVFTGTQLQHDIYLDAREEGVLGIILGWEGKTQAQRIQIRWDCSSSQSAWSIQVGRKAYKSWEEASGVGVGSREVGAAIGFRGAGTGS